MKNKLKSSKDKISLIRNNKEYTWSHNLNQTCLQTGVITAFWVIKSKFSHYPFWAFFNVKTLQENRKKFKFSTNHTRLTPATQEFVPNIQIGTVGIGGWASNTHLRKIYQNLSRQVEFSYLHKTRSSYLSAGNQVVWNFTLSAKSDYVRTTFYGYTRIKLAWTFGIGFFWFVVEMGLT